MALTVEQVIAQTVADPTSAFQAEAIRGITTYEKGNIMALRRAQAAIQKLLELEEADQSQQQ